MTPSTKSNSKPKLSEPVEGWQFEAIGTTWWIGFYEVPDNLLDIKKQITKRIEAYDKTYSRFRNDSLVTAISRKAGTYLFPDDSMALFHFYNKFNKLTAGAVTPLIGQLLSDAGYDATYSFKQGHLHMPPEWDRAVKQRGRSITTTQPVLIDVGAAGKGHLIDIITELLRHNGISDYVVDAGGDIAHHHSSALTIGLENPDDYNQIVGTYTLHNQALCGSATNRRRWGKWHHILDPHTMEPAQNSKAVWVGAASAMIADGLSTALFFVPPQTLQPHFDFTYCIVDADNSLRYSPDFAGQLFT